VHGLAVAIECDVPSLNLPIHNALGTFAVTEWPEGFSCTVGQVRAYDETTVLRHLSSTAKPVPTAGAILELYEEGERFWLLDDRWGLAEINLLKGTWQSWVLPQPTTDVVRVVENAVLWPLAQLLRGRGLSLIPAASIVRDGWSALICSPFAIEPELSALVESGARMIGQQWTALREEDGRVAMLHLPGHVERFAPPRLRAGAVHVTANREAGYRWVDLTSERPNASQHHAFCDAVLLVDRGRRPAPSMRELNKTSAVTELRAAWPIHELRRTGLFATKLAQQCPVYSVQLSRDPQDLLRLLDEMHPSGAARPLIASAAQASAT
jgi:hypothetical protein